MIEDIIEELGLADLTMGEVALRNNEVVLTLLSFLPIPGLREGLEARTRLAEENAAMALEGAQETISIKEAREHWDQQVCPALDTLADQTSEASSAARGDWSSEAATAYADMLDNNQDVAEQLSAVARQVVASLEAIEAQIEGQLLDCMWTTYAWLAEIGMLILDIIDMCLGFSTKGKSDFETGVDWNSAVSTVEEAPNTWDKINAAYDEMKQDLERVMVESATQADALLAQLEAAKRWQSPSAA